MNYLYIRDGFAFRWWGGAYIEISNAHDMQPFDVFNVWDYANDVPRIEMSLQSLVDFVDAQLAELSLAE